MRRNTLPFAFPVAGDRIQQRRAVILSKMCAADEGFCVVPVESVRSDTLELMLRLYDTYFLDGYLKKTVGDIKLSLSSRLTSSAGKFIYTKGLFGRIKDAEIRMSGDFLTRLDQGPFSLNGLSVATAQEAFLVVFEHELCHALEMALYGKTGHSARFLSLANGLFGHTATRHSLPTRRQEAAQEGLHVGARVVFSYHDEQVTGLVTYIGKMATVMVPSPKGDYRDRYGRRYVKYRVPLSCLQRVN